MPSWWSLAVLLTVPGAVLLIWGLSKLPDAAPPQSAQYRSKAPDPRARALDMQWPADATEDFTLSCKVIGRDSVFNIAWRGRDYSHAWELYNQWRSQPTVILDRSVIGEGPGRFDWTTSMISWARILPEPDGGFVAPNPPPG